jgi:Nuf2 family.|tara:strand:+ start:886 stop:1293 length:408 start_codon:yes stop_codon:yes gene_type:complete
METGIKIATIAVLLTTAEATPMVKRYTALPINIDLSARRLTLTIRYSKILVFCKALLIMNKNAIVITAGFEKPESASDGVKYPNIKRMVNNIIAVTSIENISVTNIIKPKRSRTKTSIISGVITILIFNQSNKAS